MADSEDKTLFDNTAFHQEVEGDRNQIIAQMLGGTAIGNVETLNQYVQTQQRSFSLYQLPPDVSDFVGREEEIGHLNSLLTSGQPFVRYVLSGMAGIGKSALAVHVAHQLKKSTFPDAQLYVDLRGADGKPLNAFDVLSQWLRALGIEEQSMPNDLSERVKLYRSQLANKHALVLIDNAQDEQHLLPLLPGSETCGVLITSRQRLAALEGATILDLQVLSQKDSLGLLESLIGTERLQAELDIAHRIAEECGSLPLALRISGATLKQKPYWKLGDYTRRLKDEQKKLSQLQISHLDVRSSFALSYRELNTDAALLFRRLGLLEGVDFNIQLATALIDEDSSVVSEPEEHKVFEAQTLLIIEQLLDAQLLEALGNKRYRFHDLMRLFAKEKFLEVETPESQKATKEKIIDFYCDALSPLSLFTRLRISKSIPRSSQEFRRKMKRFALNWCSEEWSNLLSILEWMQQLEMFQEIVDVVGELGAFFEARSYCLSDWNYIFSQALKAAHKIESQELEGNFLFSLGRTTLGQRYLENAKDYFQESLQIYRNLGNFKQQGACLSELASVCHTKGDLEEAISYHKQALDLLIDDDSYYERSITLSQLGCVYLDQKRYEEAVDCHQEVLKSARECNDLLGEGKTLTNLGNIYVAQNRFEEAVECFENSLQIKRELGYRYSEVVTLNNLAKLHSQQKNWEKAIPYYEQSAQICQDFDDLKQLASILLKLGNIYFETLCFEQAINYFDQSLQIFQSLKDFKNIGIAYHRKAKISRKQNNWQLSIEANREALNAFQQANHDTWYASILFDLASTYVHLKAWDEAISYSEQFLQSCVERNDTHWEGVALKGLGWLYRRKKRHHYAMSLWQEALTKLESNSSQHRELKRWLLKAQLMRIAIRWLPGIVIFLIGVLIFVLW